MKGLKQKFKRPATNSPLPKDATWTHQDQRVWQAVASNHPPKVAAKLTKHPDVDVNRICPNVGYSVVHYAAAKGLDDCLNILLAHKADAAACDITGATPLHAAARYGHKGTTSKLLASRFIEVNRSDNNQCTALHFAAFEGHVDCVKLIADVSDVNLNCTDKDGRTPLMVAAAMGRTDVVKALVEKGCDINHRDVKLGHTALTLAADSGHASVVRLLCESGANHEETLVDGRTALHLAKQKDRRSVVDALHIVQLTEAANKSGSAGPRLSVSSNKYKLDDPSVKKRHSCDGILDSVHQTYIDDLVAGTHLSTGSRTPKPSRKTKEDKKHMKSNISRVKAAVGAKIKSSSPRRESDGSAMSTSSTPKQKSKNDARNGANALPLYTAGSANFYEKELKFYDSNSSLDVSSTCSAMNNISKSMDSLRPMPEEVNSNSTVTSFSQSQTPKSTASRAKKKTDDAAMARLEKMTEEQQKRISQLEEALRKTSDEAVAKEKLQRNAEEVRNNQIAATKEEYERKEAQRKVEFEQLKQISVDFEHQNKDLLKRLSNNQHLLSSLNSTKEQLRKHEESNSSLRDENKTLLEKIDSVEAENENLKKEVEKGQISESAIIAQAKEKIHEAEHRCNQAEQRATEWEQKHASIHIKTTEAESKSFQLKQKLTEVEKRCFDLGNIRNNLEEKYARTELELTQVNEQRNDVEDKLSGIMKEKRTVDRELKKLKETNSKNQAKMKSYKAELEEVTTLLKEAGFKSDDSPLSIKPGVHLLLEKLKAEEGNVTSSETKKKVLEDKLNTSIDEKNRTIEDLQKRIKESEDALHQKAAECSRLDSELRHTKVCLSKLDVEKQKVEEELGIELTKSRAELAKYEAIKLAEASDFSRSKHEVCDLRQQLDDALTALEKMREESVPREAYESDCAKIKKDADILKKEVTKTLEKFALLQLELASKEQELSDLRVERNQSEAKSIKCENEASQIKSKCHESEVQVNVLRQQLTETKQKLNKAMDEINTLRTSHRDMTLRLSAKNSEINDSERKNITSLKKQVDNLSRHLQESEKKHKETITIYRGHLLASITGQLDEDVQQALQEILKLRVKDDDKLQLTSHAT